MSLLEVRKLLKADKVLRARFDQETATLWQQLREKIFALKQEDFEKLQTELQQMEQSETARKERIEAKANIIITGCATALVVVTAIPLLVDLSHQTKGWTAFLTALLMCFAICFWLASGILAFCATKVIAMHKLSAASVAGWIDAANTHPIDRSAASDRYANIKVNESILSLKANFQSVAQGAFVEGLVLIACALLVLVASLLWRQLPFKPLGHILKQWLLDAVPLLHGCFVIAVPIMFVVVIGCMAALLVGAIIALIRALNKKVTPREIWVTSRLMQLRTRSRNNRIRYYLRRQ